MFGKYRERWRISNFRFVYTAMLTVIDIGLWRIAFITNTRWQYVFAALAGAWSVMTVTNYRLARQNYRTQRLLKMATRLAGNGGFLPPRDPGSFVK